MYQKEFSVNRRCAQRCGRAQNREENQLLCGELLNGMQTFFFLHAQLSIFQIWLVFYFLVGEYSQSHLFSHSGASNRYRRRLGFEKNSKEITITVLYGTRLKAKLSVKFAMAKTWSSQILNALRQGYFIDETNFLSL